MHADLVPDDLWERVAPLLPPAPERRRRYPGRLRVPDRVALAGILFVLRTGVAWRDVPAETVGCSGVTAWRRLRDWTEVGVWPRLHAALLTELRSVGLLDLDDCSVDGSHVRALKRGDHVGPSPVDRARPGSKHHLIVDRHGTPLAVTLTGGNRHDVTRLLPLLDAVPPIRGLRGRPRRKPGHLYTDRGYDFDKYRRLVWKRGIKPLIARRGVSHGSGLGKVRWVVERAFAWLHQFKRLRIRYERRADLHQGLLDLGCSLICLRRLQRAVDRASSGDGPRPR
ncbi:IS5 family transposase [Streptomyces sp. NPDC049590]|uniref:IS5 family transposase n=1 Tax=Streptomyces sp. NPDC049590 TaxID=3154834 RepID=UPI00341A15C1